MTKRVNSTEKKPSPALPLHIMGKISVHFMYNHNFLYFICIRGWRFFVIESVLNLTTSPHKEKRGIDYEVKLSVCLWLRHVLTPRRVHIVHHGGAAQ